MAWHGVGVNVNSHFFQSGNLGEDHDVAGNIFLLRPSVLRSSGAAQSIHPAEVMCSVVIDPETEKMSL